MNFDSDLLEINPGDFSNNFSYTDNDCAYSQTNIWNHSLTSPEFNCNHQTVYNEIMEIKILVSEIKNLLKNYFSEE